MAKDLGETQDPRELVPGDAGSVAATAQALRTRGDALLEAGSGLRRIDTSEGWSGAAADAFRARFRGQPGSWLEAGDCLHTAAETLINYSGTLTWAQQQAAMAIAHWDAAGSATDLATTQHRRAEQQAGRPLPFDDPGAAGRLAARELLGRARQQLDAAGDDAADRVDRAADKAPAKPGFWSRAGDFFADAGAGLANAGGHVLNGLASLGNAMLHHPGDVATAAGGAALIVLGAAGDVGGGLLDLTGVGALVGVPVNIVSTAAVVTGGGLVAAAGGDLMMNAANEDGVSPARTDHTGSDAEEGYEPTAGFRNSEYSQEEFVEFVNGHTGDANPAMDRPTPEEIEEALAKGTPEPLPGQNAELFRYGRIKVILNYDMPWRSTSYVIGGR
jgi:type VII secretion system ESX-1 substrate